MLADEKLSVEEAKNPKTIVIDYGGPNVAKPLHGGHLRSAIIGESIKRMGRFLGHKVIGDVVLRTLATYLASWTRDYETVYRYGGEEFIIIVKAANDEEACRAGIRICQLVDNHAIKHSEGHINITVTAGVSRAFPEEPLDVVIGRADRAMYEGKQTGRNRCMFIDEQNVINRV